ncbi:MAG: peptide-methionine (R)-S-oxide reductase MsrB [Thermoleophilia bacterium]|nr:peptide-methionine (R)-S-oxide reductase MsrB [Thermoleophilia bacterium]
MSKRKVHKTEEEWRRELSPEEFQVCRLGGTEPAFSGDYGMTLKEGVYHCVACGNELFDAKAKFDSGTGWPSFFEPIRPDAVTYERDTSHGMDRIEVRCGVCDSHLGHVFEDGPEPTGKRYCINSVCLEHD